MPSLGVTTVPLRSRRTGGSALVSQGFRIQPGDSQVGMKDVGILIYGVPGISETTLLLLLQYEAHVKHQSLTFVSLGA